MIVSLKLALATTLFSASHEYASGFSIPSSINTPVASSITSLKSAVVSGDVSGVVNGAADQKAWDCDEEANCVQIDACDEEKCRTTLDVRIHGEWYDLSGKPILP
jgi:hypothetical protein